MLYTRYFLVCVFIEEWNKNIQILTTKQKNVNFGNVIDTGTPVGQGVHYEFHAIYYVHGI